MGKKNKSKKIKALPKELIRAVYIGDSEYVKQILTKKFLKTHDINTRIDDYTLLSIASQSGHIEVINILLRVGANINQNNADDRTALFIASEKGYIDVIKLLLEHAAKIDTADNQGLTALCMAFYNGHIDVAKLLLKHGASIDLANNNRETALLRASSSGHFDIVKLLLENGASIDLANNRGLTALFMASQNGHFDIVKLLLKNGASIDLANNRGATPLLIASEEDNFDIVELLLKNGASVDKPNEEAVTPLFTASHHGHFDIVELLLKNGANVNHITNRGLTPLLIVSEEDNFDIVKLLLKNGASIDLASNRGVTPLLIASEEDNFDIVELLLKNGASVDKPNEEAVTPLFTASHHGHFDIVELLLKNGASVDKPNEEAVTPLWISSQEGHFDIVKLLLENGADYNITCFGLTVLDITLFKNHLKIFHLLYKTSELSSEQKRHIFYQVKFLGIEKLMNFMQKEIAAIDSKINSITKLNKAAVPFEKNKLLKEGKIVSSVKAVDETYRNSFEKQSPHAELDIYNIISQEVHKFYQVQKKLKLTNDYKVVQHVWQRLEGVKIKDEYIIYKDGSVREEKEYKINQVYSRSGEKFYIAIISNDELLIDNELYKKFVAASEIVVGISGQQGIKLLKNSRTNELACLEIKLLGKYGDHRLCTNKVYLNSQKEKLYIFEECFTHKKLIFLLNSSSSLHIINASDTSKYSNCEARQIENSTDGMSLTSFLDKSCQLNQEMINEFTYIDEEKSMADIKLCLGET